MVALDAREADALMARLRQTPAAESVSGTIAVSANASTSVTLTPREKQVVLEVLLEWERAVANLGEGLLGLRSALARDLDVKT